MISNKGIPYSPSSSCNTPAGPVTLGSSVGYLDWSHRPTLVFPAHIVLTRAHLGMTSRSVTLRQIALGQACTLNLRVICGWASGKKCATCIYEYHINPIEPWAKMSHSSPLRRSLSLSINPKLGTSPLGTSMRPLLAHVPRRTCLQGCLLENAHHSRRVEGW
jgi:hypothetical protein